MRHRFHTLDVFTDTKLAGNPLAVVLDCDGLDDAAMQKIAREFNLSETVFCFAPRDPTHTAALRIFTPSAELSFAGHPTIGTAVLLAKLQAPDLLAREDLGLVLEEKIGPVSCAVRHRRGEAAHARFDVPVLAAPCGAPPPNAELAHQLGLEADEIGYGSHQPCCVSASRPITFVPLVSLAALGRARLRASNDEPMMYYLYTPQVGTAPPSFRTRMLSVGLGVPEDPATGSAAAAFPTAWLRAEPLTDGSHDCLLYQGVEMGRPSRIGLAFSVENGTLRSAVIGGHAVMLAEGTFDL
jgi:trans-2,3-dihydro-3-hydroxyanthranilate isomerase